MIAKNSFKLDCIVTVTQTFLLRDVEINSFDNLSSPYFFDIENLEQKKINWTILSTEITPKDLLIKELDQDLKNYLENGFQRGIFYYFSFEKDTGRLKFQDNKDCIYHLEKEQVLYFFQKGLLFCLPFCLFEEIYVYFNLKN